jgi:hypothetical protein
MEDAATWSTKEAILENEVKKLQSSNMKKLFKKSKIK